MVRAFEAKADRATPWENPETHASGLRVPGPLGDRLILRALYESNGDAASVSEDTIRADTLRLSRASGIDTAPEGGCALGVLGSSCARDAFRPTRKCWCSTRAAAPSYRF